MGNMRAGIILKFTEVRMNLNYERKDSNENVQQQPSNEFMMLWIKILIGTTRSLITFNALAIDEQY